MNKLKKLSDTKDLYISEQSEQLALEMNGNASTGMTRNGEQRHITALPSLVSLLSTQFHSSPQSIINIHKDQRWV